MLDIKGRVDNFSSDTIDALKTEVSSVREELDEHLQAINDNTSEQEIQNSYICEIDNRLTKMEEKMDELHFLLKQIATRAKLAIELSKDEQRMFLILYTHGNFMRTAEISSKTYVDVEVVEDALASMMDKGIPIDREILNGEVYFRMSKDFRLKQAKENVIKIDTDVTSQFQNTLLKQFFQS